MAKKCEQQEDALRALLVFVTSGKRYESRNPYMIPEVVQAIHALGLTIDTYDAKKINSIGKIVA